MFEPTATVSRLAHHFGEEPHPRSREQTLIVFHQPEGGAMPRYFVDYQNGNDFHKDVVEAGHSDVETARKDAAWCRKQASTPSRAEAARRPTDIGLATEKQAYDEDQ
jgi:hypothetical protein